MPGHPATAFPHPHEFTPGDHDKETPTEDMVCMKATVPQHIDGAGHKVEDDAGRGEPETMGG
ncbi:MAG: hypothetical protein SFV51_10335 [Bryobacteraceae bacterium]|nr:hypothetical protein [Bryobacteraceae bacterium]